MILGRILLLLWLFVGWTCVYCFNVDTTKPYFLESGLGQESLFGYSMAFSSIKDKLSLVVGAPKAKVSNSSIETGAVFVCSLEGQQPSCIPIPKLTKPILRMDSFVEEDQWLGASLAVSKQDLMICSPRYSLLHQNNYIMYGRCTVMDALSGNVTKEWTPCYDVYPPKGKSTHAKTAQECMVGFSAAMFDQGFAAGAPLLGQPATRFAMHFSKVPTSIFAPALGDNSPVTLLGYTLHATLPDVYGTQYLLAAAPLSNLQAGLVAVYPLYPNLKMPLELIKPPNSQFGQFFGNSIASVDLNGDRYPDVVIGSPYYSFAKDEGVVYVYMNSKKALASGSSGGLFQGKRFTLTGDKKVGAYFGYSLANAGDLNADSYSDIVIGAPDLGDSGKGTIYIYHGSSNGIREEYSQVIKASDVKLNTLSFFGYSVAAGTDVDSNGYPDIAVSALRSDKVFILRTRPIIRIDGTLSVSTNAIAMNSSGKTCVSSYDNRTYKCVQVTGCLHFLSPKNTTTVAKADVSYSLIVDSLVKYPRAFLSLPGARLSRLEKQETVPTNTCRTFDMLLHDRTADMNTPIWLTFKYNLVTENCQDSLCPVQDADVANEQTAVVHLQNDCGPDNICTPDLEVTMFYTLTGVDDVNVVVGETLPVNLVVSVKNNGEFGYMPYLDLIFDAAVDIAGYRFLSGFVPAETTWLILPENKRNFSMLMDTPILPKRIEDLVFSITIPPTLRGIQKLDFLIIARVQGDTNTLNNNASLSLPLFYQVDIDVSGKASVEQVQLSQPKPKSSVKVLDDIGPEITFVFQVGNRGPSSLYDVRVLFYYPLWYLDSRLLYLTSIKGDKAYQCNMTVDNMDSLLGLSNEKDPVLFRKGDMVDSGTGQPISHREEQYLDCSSHGECTLFQCYIGSLDKGFQETYVINTRLNMANLTLKQTLVLGTYMHLKFREDSDISFKGLYELTVNITLLPPFKLVRDPFPWWLFLLSAVAALIILCLLGYCLHKRGFFARNVAWKQKQDLEKDEASVPLTTVEA